jgi:hypothetical protein
LDLSATNIFQFLIFGCSLISDGGCSSGDDGGDDDGGDDGGDDDGGDDDGGDDDGGGCSSGVHLQMLVGLEL